MMVSIGALTNEICRISRIADALVLRFLGIRAERPGESRRLRRVLGCMGCERLICGGDQHVRRDALLDPAL